MRVPTIGAGLAAWFRGHQVWIKCSRSASSPEHGCSGSSRRQEVPEVESSRELWCNGLAGTSSSLQGRHLASVLAIDSLSRWSLASRHSYSARSAGHRRGGSPSGRPGRSRRRPSAWHLLVCWSSAASADRLQRSGRTRAETPSSSSLLSEKSQNGPIRSKHVANAVVFRSTQVPHRACRKCGEGSSDRAWKSTAS